ncbi:LamG domain-containing protein [Cellvibrio sp. KY-YJ-3]|uniref:LamG domain-containing protein n=1 Tax=Cellvibrio sp. KY-YJ-3 TaxID=454662 RepID=UPI001CD97231|nr:LamG domain-containing protein [Cellvibrio sp. KY-YJ-3]
MRITIASSLLQWHKPKLGRAALAILTLTAGLLGGCGGSGSGSEVTPNNPPPPATGGDNFTYRGEKPAGTEDIIKFQNELWINMAREDRCGGCHQVQAPTFARGDDINLAYASVIDEALVTLSDPASSRLVTKVAGGHNCWLADAGACADIMTGWINKWAGPRETSANDVVLKAPADRAIDNTKSFPSDSNSFATNVYPLLTEYCAACHAESAATRQQPYLASSDIAVAYEAAKSRMRLDNPAQSRLVQRLRADSHNCWDNDCAASANQMQAAIQALADSITAIEVDPDLVVSKAVGLGDAFVLSSGGRIDSDIIAKYEFKTGKGTVAFDTSGVDPVADLNLIGNVSWSSAWGVKFADTGRAQATVSGSRKLYDLLLGSGEYTIETWIIPDSLDQGANDNNPARIVSYSGSTTERNFTLGQYDYNYIGMNRTGESDANGEPVLATNDNDERAQASLQHVVLSFDPIRGRRLYVNGEFTGDNDATAGAFLKDWDNGHALVVGNEVSGNRPWAGSLRFLAIHKRAMSEGDIKTNFDVGVGARYLLLFNVSELIDQPACFTTTTEGTSGQCFIVFEVQQIDDYGYQFAAPFFTVLGDGALTSAVPLKGIRIGVNGTEAPVGQVFANINTQLAAGELTDGRQTLSPLGTVVEAKNGPEEDVFFLTFDQIGSSSYTRVVATPPPPAAPADIPDQPTLGLRDFAEINASLAAMTGIPATNTLVASTYEKVKQQLPTLTNLDGFLAAQQMGITQLTVAYCNAVVGNSSAVNTARAALFPGFDFSATANVAFNTPEKRDLIIEPLLTRLLANEVADGANPHSQLDGQADPAELRLELNQLIDNMTSCGSGCAADRTLTTVKATCAASLGSAVMLLQ